MPSSARKRPLRTRGVKVRRRWNGPCPLRLRTTSSRPCRASSTRTTKAAELGGFRRPAPPQRAWVFTSLPARSRPPRGLFGLVTAFRNFVMSTMSNSLAETQVESLATAGLSQGDVSDFFALLKPRVMFLVVFTALVGMVVSPSNVHPVVAFVSLLLIAIGGS